MSQQKTRVEPEIGAITRGAFRNFFVFKMSDGSLETGNCVPLNADTVAGYCLLSETTHHERPRYQIAIQFREGEWSLMEGGEKLRKIIRSTIPEMQFEANGTERGAHKIPHLLAATMGDKGDSASYLIANRRVWARPVSIAAFSALFFLLCTRGDPCGYIFGSYQFALPGAMIISSFFGVIFGLLAGSAIHEADMKRLEAKYMTVDQIKKRDRERREAMRSISVQQTDERSLSCPVCGSQMAYVGTSNKGFSVGKAAAGAVLVGPIGLVGGALGKKRAMYYCQSCGFQDERKAN